MILPQGFRHIIIDSHISFFIQNLPEMKVMVHETNQLSGQYLEEAAELRRRYVRLVRGILDEIRGKQKTKDISTGTASFLLFGMMNWLYTWYSPEHDADPKVVSAAVKEVFLNGFLN